MPNQVIAKVLVLLPILVGHNRTPPRQLTQDKHPAHHEVVIRSLPQTAIVHHHEVAIHLVLPQAAIMHHHEVAIHLVLPQAAIVTRHQVVREVRIVADLLARVALIAEEVHEVVEGAFTVEEVPEVVAATEVADNFLLAKTPP